ncbi:hypothetical protein LXA43DRAFT_510359 [Ganoderma leucocontextum]|nr:hypothetical protein LXA43DRAFT_510359 [Ganoderma leucocontextum]
MYATPQVVPPSLGMHGCPVHSSIRLLWSTLDTLTPLWLLLAPATLTRKQRASDDLLQTQIIDAQLWNDPDRWDRFLYYAQLVRKVSFCPDLDKPSELHVQLVRTVVEHNGGQTVLPSLRVFVWSLPTQRDGGMVRLLSPNVVQLVWKPNSIGPGGATAVINILRSVRNAAPLLEAYVSPSFWFQVPLHWIVDELGQFQNLRNHPRMNPRPVFQCVPERYVCSRFTERLPILLRYSQHGSSLRSKAPRSPSTTRAMTTQMPTSPSLPLPSSHHFPRPCSARSISRSATRPPPTALPRCRSRTSSARLSSSATWCRSRCGQLV